jgi:MerR family transcriptional regulator, copper efflux regulator
MRITEAARVLGTSPRMLRYRESLGLLPRSPRGQRRYDERDLALARSVLELERRYDVSPAELAFALRTVAEPEVGAAVRELGVRVGRISTPPTPAEIDRERALRWLGRSGMLPPPRSPGPR